jgi:hypothetical protein
MNSVLIKDIAFHYYMVYKTTKPNIVSHMISNKQTKSSHETLDASLDNIPFASNNDSHCPTSLVSTYPISRISSEVRLCFGASIYVSGFKDAF